MNEITIAFLISIAVAFALYSQIQKLTQNIDANEANQNNQGSQTQKAKILLTNAEISDDQIAIYKSFCDEIDYQIRELKQKALYDDMLKSDDLKDEFLAELSQASRKLTFIQNMNSKKGISEWEAELFEILNMIEKSVQNALKNADVINDEIRSNLQASFSKLKA
ncbi:hypothetical protein LMG7974_00543 [Campylobacter majalis]|uniref:Periplasmic protein n=1 Tax=Campylobacter majalis TaxID=2790656 RepID=A0ABN7K8P4_9BACT|nr:hypothetical protein [Campylobacter majalis]CAD7287663.1 hypothetical protein LMG7974_00543 [Campylobacter majalis]